MGALLHSTAWVDVQSAPIQAGGWPSHLLRRPQSPPHAPLVLHLHGGGFVRRPTMTPAPMARLLTAAGATVVSLDYPLAPEHPFPQPLQAAHAALAWMHMHRGDLAGSRSPLIVAGEEAGGNLAAALALMARDQGAPQLDAQLLLWPMLDPQLATASVRQARAGHAQCPLAEGWHAYLPRCADAAHPYAAPLHSQRLRGLAKALIVTSQGDCLRDEALAYAVRLRAAGVGTREHVLEVSFADTDEAVTRESDLPRIAPLCTVFEQFLSSFGEASHRVAA
jgi:acetyl esterase/lipase